jgi:hypothetical protein
MASTANLTVSSSPVIVESVRSQPDRTPQLCPVLKLNRTIADLAGAEAITHAHLAEALQYRPKLELM